MTTFDWLLFVAVVTAMAAVALWGSFRLSQRTKEMIVMIVFLLLALPLLLPAH